MSGDRGNGTTRPGTVTPYKVEASLSPDAISPRGFETTTKAGRLRRWLLDAYRRHEDDGTLPTSGRHLFYEAVMASVIAKGDPQRKAGRGRRADQDLCDALTWLRANLYVPWDAVEDRTRHLMDFRGDGPTMAEAFMNVLDGIRVDCWGDLLPVLVVESESGAGVLAGIASYYRVVVVPTRGQTNGWLRTTVAASIGGRAVEVAYIGDADKAGGDIEANTRRVLDEVVTVKSWERLALTWAQVDTLGLPTVERHDKRDGMTRVVCELEALPQRDLNTALSGWLDARLPVDLDDVRRRERGERDELRRLIDEERS